MAAPRPSGYAVGYAVGPAAAVFDAVRSFGEAVGVLGLELQQTKCKCCCPLGPHTVATDRHDSFPIGEARDSDGVLRGYGIKVGGVPVGDP